MYSRAKSHNFRVTPTLTLINRRSVRSVAHLGLVRQLAVGQTDPPASEGLGTQDYTYDINQLL